ncbi:MAG: hypothetical protein WD648_13475 [Planctomycetaceae bacterium]
MTREQIDAAISRHAETETLYDQPYVDKKTVRVTGPFTVESLSPHRTISADEKKARSEYWKDGRNLKIVGPDDFGHMILENLRKAGVQNTVKQERLKFDSLEPYAGEWIHGQGTYTERVDSAGMDSGSNKSTMHHAPVTKRVAVCIGPEYGTVGTTLVKEAAKEAVKGVGFDVLIVCGFAFDPSVSEETKRYGKLVVLPTRMNPDLSMGDELLKKTGAGNLFMVFGEPDVVVDSDEWIVDSRGRRVMRIERLKRLSGLGSLEEINRAGSDNPAYFQELSSRRTLRADIPDTSGGGVGGSEHRGRGRTKQHEGVRSISRDRAGLGSRNRDVAHSGPGVRVPEGGGERTPADGSASDSQDALSADEVAALQALTPAALPLSTIHSTQVTILGLDVYDPTTGEIRSSSTDDIACWFIDTNYNSESFFVRHAYFTGADEPYEKLKRALRAEIDEAAWSSLYSTTSRPFDNPETGKIAVKVINHYGDEVLKVFQLT